jgi:hypothetical protein
VPRALPVVLLALVACGDDHIDGAKAASAIKARLATHDDVPLATLTCPSRPYKTGDKFTCAGTTIDQQQVAVDVTQQGSGNLEWQLEGMPLHAAKIRSEILPKLGSGFELQCPHEVAVVEIGAWTQCSLKRDGQTARLDVRVDDLQGNESYKVEQ